MGQQNRGQLAHFLADKDETLYQRLAKGFSELSNSSNAQTREVTYIDDSTDSTITAFQNSWGIQGSVYDEDPVNDMLLDLSIKQAKGDNAVLYMVQVYLWKPSVNNPDTVFQAFKQQVAWVPDNDGGGAGGDTVSFSGSLNAKGDRIHGFAKITKSDDPAIPWTCEFTTTEPPEPEE
jgi:hypothetical protein